MNLPMLVVWIIAFSVTFIVMGAAYSHRTKGEAIGMALATVAGITFWITGLVLGAFVTHFSSPTPETWWYALAVRVAWQVGGALFFGLALLTDALLMKRGSLRKPGVWIFVGVCVAIGALFSLNAIRDLAEGPLALHGAAEIDVERRSRVRGGASISATLSFASDDGRRLEWNLVGWPAEKAEEELAKCGSAEDVDVLLLRRTRRILGVRCAAPQESP